MEQRPELVVLADRESDDSYSTNYGGDDRLDTIIDLLTEQNAMLAAVLEAVTPSES
jgi:hypothetical protein